MSAQCRVVKGADNVDEELQIARALRDSLFAEREAIERLSPDRQQRIFARIEKILDLLEKLERLKLQRAAILGSKGSS
jgi:hypothetical protein